MILYNRNSWRLPAGALQNLLLSGTAGTRISEMVGTAAKSC
jgi:hypothetical protein